MESYPQHQQLQKNVLLTICTDRILQDVSFDRYRCSRLVLNCLCSYDEESMKRMSVAIISILAARISTQVGALTQSCFDQISGLMHRSFYPLSTRKSLGV